MGTEVLRPQDCLFDRVRIAPVVFHQHRRAGNGGANARVGNRKPVVRPEQKKRPENENRRLPARSKSLDDVKKTPSGNNRLVMGQVMILKRGESLDSKIGGERHRQNRLGKKARDDLVLCGTARLGPDPGMVPKQIRVGDLKQAHLSPSVDRPDVYAGSAFSVSPSPRSLPLPSFFSKKQVSKVVDDDSATRDLRRLLRLE